MNRGLSIINKILIKWMQWFIGEYTKDEVDLVQNFEDGLMLEKNLLMWFNTLVEKQGYISRCRKSI
jgi:hypothetical protein